jgi:hypothetical protein
MTYYITYFYAIFSIICCSRHLKSRKDYDENLAHRTFYVYKGTFL